MITHCKIYASYVQTAIHKLIRFVQRKEFNIWPCGEIGKHCEFKPRRRKVCRFESDHGYQSKSGWSSMVDASDS